MIRPRCSPARRAATQRDAMNMTEFAQGVVQSVDKERLANREKFLAAAAIMVCWTGLAMGGYTQIDPLIRMYELILGGLGVFGAAAWKAK